MGSNHHFPTSIFQIKIYPYHIASSVRNEMIDIISRHHRTPFWFMNPASVFIIMFLMFLNKYHNIEHTRA